jgi:hypothetical protein
MNDCEEGPAGSGRLGELWGVEEWWSIVKSLLPGSEMDQGTDGSLLERVRTWLLMMVEAKPDVVNREFRTVAYWREASGAWLSWIFNSDAGSSELSGFSSIFFWRSIELFQN